MSVTSSTTKSVGPFIAVLNPKPDGDSNYQKRIAAFNTAMTACDRVGGIGYEAVRDLRTSFFRLPLDVLMPLGKKITDLGGKPFGFCPDLYEKLTALFSPKKEVAVTLHEQIYQSANSAVMAFRNLLEACVMYEESGVDPNQGELRVQLQLLFKALPHEILIPISKKLFRGTTEKLEQMRLYDDLKLIVAPIIPKIGIDVKPARVAAPLDPSEPKSRWKGTWDPSTKTYWKPDLHELVYTHAYACWPETSDFRVALEACLFAKRAGFDTNNRTTQLHKHLEKRFTALSTSVKQHFIPQFTYGNHGSYFELTNFAEQLIEMVRPQVGEYRGCCTEAHKGRFMPKNW
jgi:hypothetical protein